MDKFILDPSLFTPESIEFLKNFPEETNTKYYVTKGMAEILENEQNLAKILHHWDIAPAAARLVHKSVLAAVYEKSVFGKIDVSRETREMLMTSIAMNITLDPVVQSFLCDEMLLAIISGSPIICISSSEWRIVKFFERIGIRVKRRVNLHIEEKKQFFQTKKAKTTIFVIGLGTALVFVVGGPVAGITKLAIGALKLIVVDP